MTAPPTAGPAGGRSLVGYAVAVAITVGAVLSQYVVPERWPLTRSVYDNLPGDLLVVYGLPIVAFAVLVGVAPLRAWRQRLRLAAWRGLGWYGALSLLALAVVFFLVIIYDIVDPHALELLRRTSPPLVAARSDPWFYVGLSFAIGAVEETIFRGWIFGFWSGRTTRWVVPATWTSALFAAVHLYYGTTYGAASPLIFPTLFLAGFAFAATYRASGGNLVVPALLHGGMDASAYLTLVNDAVALAIHYGLIAVGGVCALIAYLRGEWDDPPVATGAPAPGP